MKQIKRILFGRCCHFIKFYWQQIIPKTHFHNIFFKLHFVKSFGLLRDIFYFSFEFLGLGLILYHIYWRREVKKQPFADVFQNKLQDRCFSVNIAKFLRIAFFHRTPPVAASGSHSIVLDPQTIPKQNLTSKSFY